ncbi:hypothetical protein [Thioalkalivibrio sp. ALJ8]|uniref:hypothetical protein n=1 Tax=Thioalkalivibrio sp. ALJ8 TaxID=1158757 RepID=UPI0003664270|nr:hypothetical protein [Thioalkalivibrio sp. ALJ8]
MSALEAAMATLLYIAPVFLAFSVMALIADVIERYRAHWPRLRLPRFLRVPKVAR